MRSEIQSEDSSKLARTLSQHEADQNIKKPISKKKVVRSADDEHEDKEDSFSLEDFEKPEPPHIQPVIRKEDFAEEIVFGRDIVKSEEYSVDAELLQLRNQEKLNKELKRNEPTRGNTVLNIIVCGGKETGKSSFIETFENSKHPSNQSSRQPTTSIVYKKFMKKLDGNLFDIRLIDTPGYREEHLDQYTSLITKQIVTKLQSYYKLEQEQKEDRNRILSGSKEQIPDERVHCCLYFLRGSRVHKEDCYIMKELQKYVNIIPIISKGDCYTLDEIKQFKKQLLIAKETHELAWVECEEIVRSKQPEMVKQLLEGPFGQAPPFVIISGVSNIITSSNNVLQGRKYTWGTVNIANRNHSDFQLLNQMLLIYLSTALIQLTTLIQTQYIRKQLQQEKQRQSFIKHQKRKKSKRIDTILQTVGGGIVFGFVGLLLYKLLQKKVEKH